MIKKRKFSILMVFLFTLFVVPGALADKEVIVERDFTSLTPVFMAGHPGELEWIEGFDFTCDILLDGKKVGICSGENRLLNPPQNLAERYDTWMIKITNTIFSEPEDWTFEVTGLSTGMGSSSIFKDGIITFAWHGSISNGTGALSDICGWSGGSGTANVFTGQGGATEVILYRIGY